MRPARSLAEVGRDEAAVIRRILFEGLRERCGDLGLREGDRLVSGGCVGETLLLRTREGGSLRCPSALARFIEVEAEPGGPRGLRGAAGKRGGEAGT
jgi:hypothetical protein